MEPIKTQSTNLILNEDEVDQTKEPVGKLPVTIDLTKSMMHSFWMPTEQDIANILAGMPIRLTVVGKGHPPVALTVTDKI